MRRVLVTLGRVMLFGVIMGPTGPVTSVAAGAERPSLMGCCEQPLPPSAAEARASAAGTGHGGGGTVAAQEPVRVKMLPATEIPALYGLTAGPIPAPLLPVKPLTLTYAGDPIYWRSSWTSRPTTYRTNSAFRPLSLEFPGCHDPLKFGVKPRPLTLHHQPLGFLPREAALIQH